MKRPGFMPSWSLEEGWDLPTCIYLTMFVTVIFLGCKCLHSKLFSIHYVGSVFCFPGSLPGQSVCSLCLWLWNPRGEFLFMDIQKNKPKKKKRSFAAFSYSRTVLSGSIRNKKIVFPPLVPSFFCLTCLSKIFVAENVQVPLWLVKFWQWRSMYIELKTDSSRSSFYGVQLFVSKALMRRLYSVFFGRNYLDQLQDRNF